MNFIRAALKSMENWFAIVSYTNVTWYYNRVNCLYLVEYVCVCVCMSSGHRMSFIV